MKTMSKMLWGMLLLVSAPSALAEPAYNEVRQKSSHNSYQRYEALLDQLVYHRVRSVELDIHNAKGTSWPAVTGNWYVYHSSTEPATSCHRLSDCLNELRAFHLENPSHEVVTVWVDLKDPFETGRMPADLDTRITTHLPSTWLFTPADLMARCTGATSLQAAVTGACGWPQTSELRGKFIFAFTGGDLSSSTSKLNVYVSNGSTATSRVGFVAPDLSSASGIGLKNYAVFFNMAIADVALGANVDAAGFVGRVWVADNSTDWSAAVNARIHHIGTNKVNYHVDPWAVTHDSQGWPFQCFDPLACGAYQEPANVIGAEVDSGDIWDSADSFAFAYEVNSAVTTSTWTAAIDTPNSHVEEWAKGCLMARAGTASNARYFAVCRPADNHKLRIQYRTSAGGTSSSAEVDIVPADTIDQESLTYVRLKAVYDGTQTCAYGYGSQNGSSWTLIGSKCFSGTLAYQGVAASSHGSGKVKLLFVNTNRNGVTYTQGSFPAKAAIGSGVTSYRVFDGVM